MGGLRGAEQGQYGVGALAAGGGEGGRDDEGFGAVAVRVEVGGRDAVRVEPEERRGTSGVYAVDMAVGRTLWTLDPARATTATVAGCGVVYVRTPEGTHDAVDDRTGGVRETGLDHARALVLDHAQVTDDGSSLSGPAVTSTRDPGPRTGRTRPQRVPSA